MSEVLDIMVAARLPKLSVCEVLFPTDVCWTLLLLPGLFYLHEGLFAPGLFWILSSERSFSSELRADFFLLISGASNN